ncbi:mannose-1-phosphate guanylyltransferase/mannose-6-phosphate isomerase [Sulfurovum sp. ST-21]|uniref:mannose-1-phosphate guanylyltransferase n=1 Tax=Sulfurovum indicum TaxID=2779528 RepID=A0A7M1S3Q2_9BACT|nr:mannose-1-phosphate guanylyltransferase/mannose-6-phosphate isomerase [Sulfurovum indicum]QOR61946.1 mannose-1-phosphate guanylyltransferase/mannose-6-phosphate isomerase [Sulfurovum indicum]
MTTVILSGGNGTRMWPISRTLMPKQFVRFDNNRSLFQRTVLRNLPLSDKIMIVSNDAQKFLVLDQLYGFGNVNSSYIWESIGKNSAAAIIMAALNSDEDEILCIVPSDHLIKDQSEYEKTIRKAEALAKENNIVAVGIEATFPATGYGYICHDGEDVISFTEKPEEDTARSFLEQGNYLWNGGIYCFKASHFINECKRVIPELFEKVVQAFNAAVVTDNECHITAQSVENLESVSIDDALMEKLSSNFKVVPLSAKWSDMGSFDAIDDICENTDYINVNNNENTISIRSKNNCIISSERMIATVDVNDLIIVDTPDALLITKKGSSQDVKEVVKELKKRNSDLVTTPSTVARPWGNYTVLENNKAYKTKKIVVRPGKRLSLQSHFHRNEHWIVVSGTARVTVGDEVKLLQANESTYIPAGEKHRLENPGVIDLVMIEAQVGEYLEEDDIVRYEDDFNRVA